MTLTAIKEVFNKLGYSDITEEFIALPNIARIDLTTNGAFYREPDGKSKYFLDEDNEVFVKASFNPDGTEIGVEAIVSIVEIVAIETRSPYSAQIFAGQNY